MKLSKDLQKAVKSTIKKDLRHEAETILLFTTNENREDFLKYYNEGSGNICCLVLDFAKRELVKKNKMIQNDNDGFGKFPFK